MGSGTSEFLAGVVVGAFFSALTAFAICNNSWEGSAIKAGVGHYVQVGTTSSMRFEWIVPSGAEKDGE